MPTRRPDWTEEPLFKPGPAVAAPRPKRAKVAPNRTLWTENKARLIERYLYYFVLVTKTGIYVDGFAGPQYPDVAGSWAVELVLQSQPEWLRRFYLFEIQEERVAALDELRKRYLGHRQIEVYRGDFNVRLSEILRPSAIRPKAPTFCLLDQHTFECKWSTLEQLASYKAPLRIELFYFLAHEWFGRAISAVKTSEGRERVRLWWGGDDWEGLRSLSGMERALLFSRRMKDELGYASAEPYAIYKREGGNRIAYWMIHATDHPEAPKLMDRAYASAVEPTREPLDQVKMQLGIR